MTELRAASASDASAAFDAVDLVASEIDRSGGTLSADQVIAKLLAELEQNLSSAGEYHALFDARLMARKQQLGLPLNRPTSFDDVPVELRDAFEETYVSCARDAGHKLVEAGRFREAWVYLRTIREPDTLVAAFEKLPLQPPPGEDVIDIAFFQGAAPVRGLEFLLASHGTCNSVTALDQQLGSFTPEVRRGCAQVMVRHLYQSLHENVQADVQRRHPMTEPGKSLFELIVGREYLFADENYHIDVSHLNAVVRFSRSLEPNSPELPLAIELAEYGKRLSSKYQYPGHVPFEDVYAAHIHYLNLLAGRETTAGWKYFQHQVEQQTEPGARALSAFALCDLYQRLGKLNEAAEIACKELLDTAEEFELSIAGLCAKAGRLDLLQSAARRKGDLVAYTAAAIQRIQAAQAPSTTGETGTRSKQDDRPKLTPVTDSAG